ncbi:NUDIX domain-containing protein [Arthrobacter psychrolactophilus]
MNPSHSAPLAPLEDACTVVLLRDGVAGLETLMLERPQSSRTFGGAWVFPGGKVDAADRLDGNGGTVDDFSAAQRAGLRELAEETGQLLDLVSWSGYRSGRRCNGSRVVSGPGS